MTKLGKMEVTRIDDEIIVITQELENETGCYVSKISDDSIEGRYLHALARAILETEVSHDNQ